MPLRVSCPGPLLRLACRGGGGAARSRFLPTWLGVARPPWAGSAHPGRTRAGGWGGGGGGAACAPRPPFARPGGAVGRGVVPPRSVPLPSLGRQQIGCRWRRSRHGGRGPHTTPVRARLPSLGAARVVLWCVGAGALAPRGSCGSRRLGRGGGPCSGSPLGRRGPAGGRGDHPLCLGGGGGLRPRGSRPAGGWGGGGRAAAPLPSLWGAARGSLPRLSLVVGAFPPGVRVRSGSRGRPVHRVQPAWRGGGGWKAAREPLPRGPCQTQAPRPPSSIGPHCSGSSPHAAPGRGPRVAPARWCGPARWPRPQREQAAGGGGARSVRVQLRFPPPRRGPFCGRGGVPSVPGGRRVGAPAARRPGGVRGGGGRGGRSAAPRPPAPSGVGVSSFVSGAPPWGMLVPWGSPGGGGRRARPGRPPVGQCGGGGGGRGGATSSPWFAPLPSPGPPPSGPLRLRRPGRRRPLVGRQRVMWERAGGSPGALGARPRLGRGGGERGGPSGPLTPPPDGRGEAAWRFRPRGASRRLGGRGLPPPPSTL